MALDITLFEVNLPEEAFTGGSKSKGKREQTQHGSDSGKSGKSEKGGRSKGKLFVALVALVGVALAVRKLRSGGSDEKEVEMAYEQPGVEVERTEP